VQQHRRRRRPLATSSKELPAADLHPSLAARRAADHLIRSVMVKGSRHRPRAGRGIVTDSVPQAEATEMGWKTQALLDELERGARCG
jgi:hypothetical protein